MDVTLPDGTVIEDVPEGTTKAQLVSKLKSNGYDTSWYKEDTPIAAQPAAKQEPRVRGYGEQLVRDLSITGRDILEGAGAIPQMLGAPMEAIGLRGAGSNVGKQLADWMGLQKPESTSERVLSSAKQAMVPGAGFIKAGQAMAAAPALSNTARMVGQTLASQPAAQLALGGVSGAAAESAEIGGLGPVGQTVAGIAAPLAVAPLAAGVMGGARGIKNIVAPLVSEEAREKGAARLAVRALGQRAEQGATALGAAADDVTAGQVAAAIDNADLAALQKIVNQRDETFASLLAKGTEAKIKTAWDTLESRLAPEREQALRLAAEGGVDPSGIFKKADAIASTSGNVTRDIVQKSMEKIKKKLVLATNPETGLADPVELNSIRGQIRNYIEAKSKKTSDWDKKTTAALERQMQLAIDDAIESAIVKADPTKKGLWAEQYMSQYREGASKIRAVEDNLKAEVKLAGKGMPQVAKVISDTEAPTKNLNLLSRIATLTNFALRAAEGSAGKGVEKKLAQMMAPSEFGGDKARLAELMRTEINKDRGLVGGMMYRPGATRQEFGYGAPEAAVPPAPTSRRIPINKDIPYSGLPNLGNPPVIPGSWREGMMTQSQSPLPVLAEDLLPVAERYQGTNIPIGTVEAGGPAVSNLPLPKLPPMERGMLSLADNAPLPKRTNPMESAIPFETKFEVANRPEIVKATNAFIQEAESLRAAIAAETNGFKKGALQARLRGLEKEFMAGWRQLGFKNEAQLRDLTQKLYQSGGETQLPIVKTERKQ